MLRWSSVLVSVLGLLGMELFGANASGAATLTVAAGSVVINSDAVCSLREAIENANADANTHAECIAVGAYGDDTIELASASTYTLEDGPFLNDGSNGLPSITGTLTINANNSILERDPMASSFRILRVASGATLFLNDATVRNGAASGMGVFGSRGGGMLDRGTSTLDNCTFTDNSGDSGGAIAYGSSNTASILNSTIGPNNTATAEGGAIFNGEPHVLQIAGSTIVGNTAASGGGIATFHIVNTTCTRITGNSASTGGGLYLTTTGQVQLLRSTVDDNDATGVSAFTGHGGGIYVGGGNFQGTGPTDLEVIDSTISGNRAVGNGGGIYNISGSTSIFSSTITDNLADSDDNGSGTGGGVANDGSSFVAGMTVFTQPGRIDFGSSVIANNSDDGNGANDCVDLQSAPLSTQFDSHGYNLIEDPAGCAVTDLANAGSNVTGQDPELPPLTFEPGRCTPTQCAATGPTIDGGVPATTGCPGSPNGEISVDQRGLPRPVSDICDIGACELQLPPDLRSVAPTASAAGLAILCLALGGLAAVSLRRQAD